MLKVGLLGNVEHSKRSNMSASASHRHSSRLRSIQTDLDGGIYDKWLPITNKGRSVHPALSKAMAKFINGSSSVTLSLPRYRTEVQRAASALKVKKSRKGRKKVEHSAQTVKYASHYVDSCYINQSIATFNTANLSDVCLIILPRKLSEEVDLMLLLGKFSEFCDLFVSLFICFLLFVCLYVCIFLLFVFRDGNSCLL